MLDVKIISVNIYLNDEIYMYEPLGVDMKGN